MKAQIKKILLMRWNSICKFSIGLFVAVLVASPASAQTNTIHIDQVSSSATGSDLTLTVVQIGSGNVIQGSNTASTAVGDGFFAILTGNTQTVVVEQVGTDNKAFLDLIGDSLTTTLVIQGDDNDVTLECIGDTCGSATMDLSIVGGLNEIDYRFGNSASISSTALNYTIVGSSNTSDDTENFGSGVINAAEATTASRSVVTEGTPAQLQRDVSGDLTLATSTAALTDGTTSFTTSDFASRNDIDGSNQNVDVIVFGDSNSFLTEVSGSNHTLDLTIDGSNSEVSIRMGSNNSTIDLRLEGDDASVAVISDDNFAR